MGGLYGIGINDYSGNCSKRIGGKKIQYKFYNTYVNMIERCYSEKWHIKHPTYIGCSICDEWKSLSNYKEWFDLNYIDGWVLDKDIIVQGNKVYSPETCAFIPHEVNLFVIGNMARRGDCMVGVSLVTDLRTKNKYLMSCRNPITKKQETKRYDNELEAHLEWKRRKCEFALMLIDVFPTMDERVKKSLSGMYK